MARGMLRGATAAWVGLIALQALTTSRGANAAGGLLTTVDGLVKRVLDPSVPAIPDHSAGAGTYDKDGNYHPTIPGFLGGGTTTAPGSDSSGQSSNPQYVPKDLPPTGQHNPQYDNPHPNTPGGVLEGYQIPWPSAPGTTTYA